jgi:RHS repeat-associated protein
VLDEDTGLYYYNARYYDPELGRFAQADSVVADASAPQSLNRYSHAANDPLNYVDPSGHAAGFVQPPEYGPPHRTLIFRDYGGLDNWSWGSYITTDFFSGWGTSYPGFSSFYAAFGSHGIAQQTLFFGIPIVGSRGGLSLDKLFNNLPPIIGVPLTSLSHIIGGLGTALQGIANGDSSIILSGIWQAGQGTLEMFGLDQAFGPKTGQHNLPVEIAEAEDSAAAAIDRSIWSANGFHGLHAMDAAVATSILGPIGPLAVAGAGIYNELFDFGSIAREWKDHGVLYWSWDTPGDLLANTAGSIIGLFLPTSLAGSVGANIGSAIPGPNH